MKTSLKRRKSPRCSIFAPQGIGGNQFADNVTACLERYASGTLLDVGCGEKPFRDRVRGPERWIGLDVEGNPSADVTGSADRIPMEDASVDTVLNTQVLEHVPDPLAALVEFYRVLVPGGYLVLSAPQYYEMHEVPHDYYRFTEYGLRYLLSRAGFTVVELRKECCGARLTGLSLNLAIDRKIPGSSIAVKAIK
ncbi:MAG: methyltransferase domain-containing protein, partial [Candidatus Eremiobacteraeota bacterium]|nr:methyltransferase domain-containing protein [Candidatus Eremiobacteraeota bacterium]